MYFSRRKVSILASGFIILVWIMMLSDRFIMDYINYSTYRNNLRKIMDLQTKNTSQNTQNNIANTGRLIEKTPDYSDLLWKLPLIDGDVIKLAAKLVNCGSAQKKARENSLLSRLGVTNEDLAFISEVVTNCSRRLLAKRRDITSGMKLCPCLSPDLVGPLVISKSPSMPQPISDVSRGSWSPSSCNTPFRIAVLAPYRNRTKQLPVFMTNIHQILQRQMAHYTVFVVEQKYPSLFNKAMLMNAGFTEIMKRDHFDCIIFHDVDLLPEDDRNIYTCHWEAVLHLGAYVKKFKYELLYDSLVGGAVAFTPAQFRLVNGFANKFYGWGGEDDDMYQRIISSGLPVWRYPPNIAKYTMLTHDRDSGNPPGLRRKEGLQARPEEYAQDGLNSLEYKVYAVDEQQLYVHYHIVLPDPPISDIDATLSP